MNNFKRILVSSLLLQLAATVLSAITVLAQERSSAQAAPLSPKVKVQIMGIRRPPTVFARYQVLKELPAGKYEPWRMDAGSVIGKKMVLSENYKDKSFLETLVLFQNVGDAEERVSVDQTRLEYSGGHADVWEWLPSGSYDGYVDLADDLGLSNAESPAKPLTCTLSFKGVFYSLLKPGEKTWVVFIFEVPKDANDPNLVIGDAPPIKIQMWKIETAKIVFQEPLENGTLVTFHVPLNSPFGGKGRAYLTPQSPFIVTRDGSVRFWTGWISSVPNDATPHLWHPLTPASVEIELLRAPNAKANEGTMNTRAIKKTDISVRKTISKRNLDQRFIDENTAEMSLFYEVAKEEIKTAGIILYSESCSQEARDKGVNTDDVKAWAKRCLAAPPIPTAGSGKRDGK